MERGSLGRSNGTKKVAPWSTVVEIQRYENCHLSFSPFCADILSPRLTKEFFLCHFAKVFSGKTLQTHRTENIEAEYVAFKETMF